MAGPHGAMDSTAYLPPSTAAIREMRNSTVASNSSSPLPIPAYRRESTQSMLLSPSSPAPPPSRSGGRITPPIRAEMSITEQIARQTRKSTVLDPKNALLIMAIPDYDDYKIMQPYSCRSLSNRSKFMGNRDFITRHNPQEVNEFKKQYSREVGNLNRHRSIVAPPTPDVSVAGLLSSSTWSAGLLSPPPKSSSSSNNNLSTLDNVLWRKTLTSSMKACWVLTDVGIQTLIGPEYRLTTRTQVLPALPSPRPQRPPLSCRSPGTPTGRPETPSMFTARDSARKGVGVDLADEKTLATLSRLASRRVIPSWIAVAKKGWQKELIACHFSKHIVVRRSQVAVGKETMEDEAIQAEASTSGEGATESPKQSQIDLRWGLHVGDVVQLTLGVKNKRSYAIYCGEGRVIHSWSPSRRSFRVRVDALRTLMLAGYVVVACSKAIDIFFQVLLALTPVSPAQVVQRAKSALHAKTTSRCSSLSLILFARYGDESFKVLESLKVEYILAHETWMKGVKASVPLPNFDDKLLLGAQANTSPPDSPAKRDSPGEHRVESSTLDIPKIRATFGSCGEYLLSEWLRRSLRDLITNPTTVNCWYAIGLPPGLMPLYLMYDKCTATFTIRFQLKSGLPERLAGDRMECGICWADFSTLKVMIMKCSHYVCEPCLQLLPRPVCPYCREPIRCAFEITEQAKQEALRLMLESTSLESSITITTAAELELELSEDDSDDELDPDADDQVDNQVQVEVDDQVEIPDQADEPEPDS
ncbi:hypothetical protein PHYBOEH_010507 [Phytophthora boehmeriae]|uniref:RING-type domain-containing protein n=1 Tax=Phytophthora boehmeriae TaxID=109152 RepID=A0A8T1X0P7_9STRA|nr:hypothetical protein PHYBOEH_010507 [Phytophthora boehmeriae]